MCRTARPMPSASGTGTERACARTCIPAQRWRRSIHVRAGMALAQPTAALALERTELGWRQDFGSKYAMGVLIGQGSFGQVHTAIHKHSGLEVAVKTLPKIRGKLSKEKTLEKICRETDMMERLQACSGVIRLLECYEDPSSVHLVTELCAGGDLQKYVEAYGPLEEKALALVAFEVLKIIKACHDLGVLHGDVKPANFCLKDKIRNPFYSRSTSYLKAIDFGCSQFLASSRRLSKRTGTPVFMSPEIFIRDYGDKADVWSFGVMVYWLYSRRFPFFHDTEVVKAARLDEVADAVSNTDIKYDFGPWPQLSLEGLDFIRRCLTRQEAARMNVYEAIQHPWFTTFISYEDRQQASRGRSSPGIDVSHAA